MVIKNAAFLMIRQKYSDFIECGLCAKGKKTAIVNGRWD